MKISFFFNSSKEMFVNSDDPNIQHKLFYSADAMTREYHGQYFLEWFIILGVLFIGSAGVFLTRYSTRYAYDVRSSSSRLLLGWILFLIALFAIMYIMGQKNYDLP